MQGASSSKDFSCSSSKTHRWKYDVFLSFRGEDTRKSFTGHLYTAMQRRGIVTFRDDERLERGKPISLELLKAIEDSRFSVVIFSSNYASSTWCLDELVKIVECMKVMGQTVLPVFYHVDPSEVRKQKGSFEDAFEMHEENFKWNLEKIQRWRDALADVSNLSGWDLRDRYEVDVIQEIVEMIFNRVSYTFSNINKNIVGMESNVKKMINYLDLEMNDAVRIIGICGMGGIGKRTFAEVVFDKISDQFEGSSFLSNIREISRKANGPVTLQAQLLSETLQEKDSITIWTARAGANMIKNRLCRKRILLVLDDVDGLDQLRVLAGSRAWFGLGSIIIITARNEHVLIQHGADKIYQLCGMNQDEAHQFFCLKAFKGRHPLEGYIQLSNEFVNYANGLPLALEVFGSFLFGRTVKEWESALKRLKEVPNREIFDVLRINYDGLEEIEKKIFLDIACFFKGDDKDRVIKILDSCGFSSEIGTRVLIDRSLVTLSDNKICMHNLIQGMGLQIIYLEQPAEPGKRSRLWSNEDVQHVLMGNTGTNAVEALIINYPEEEWDQECIGCSPKAFSNMSRLRLLKVRRCLDFPQGLEYLSKELRFLEWFQCPLKYLPPSCFPPKKIVEIIMGHSKIERLWTGMKTLENLRLINLKESHNLIETPDCTRVPNLERLVLESCTKLVRVHPSISYLKRLTLLDLRHCFCLRSLPRAIETESLEILMLSGCPRVTRIPEFGVTMKHLSELWLDETGIKELPISVIKNLPGLALLDLSRCQHLICLPSNICGMFSLKKLKLSGCSRLQGLPENLGDMECLEELIVSRTAVQKFPSSPILLKNLKELSFCGWKVSATTPWYRRPPFRPTPGSEGPVGFMLPSLSNLSSLRELSLSDCNLSDGAIPMDLGCLSSLRKLNLSRNNFSSLPASVCQLSKLTVLDLESCRMLQSLPELPLNIQYTKSQDCTSLETSSDLLKLINLSEATVSCINCFQLVRNEGCSLILHAMLKRYIQGLSYLRSRLDIIVPGSQIPDWFSQQCSGPSVVIQLPSDCQEAKFSGFALCTVFVVKEHISKKLSTSFSDHYEHKLGCHIKVNGDDFSHAPIFWFKEELDSIDLNIDAKHLWLLFLSSHYFRTTFLNSCNSFEFSFEVKGPGLEVKQSGAFLVYQQDVENFHQSISNSSWRSDESVYKDNLETS